MKHTISIFIFIMAVFAANAQTKPTPVKSTLPATTAIPITDDGILPVDSTPPGITKRSPRILTFEFDFPFKLYWMTDTGQTNQIRMINIQPKGKERNTAGMNRVEIQKLTVSINTTDDPETAYDNLKSGLIDFFSTRGFVTQPGTDFADAIYWAASFAEIVLEVQNKPKLVTDIVSIRGRDDGNNHVIFNWEQLRHYPFPKPTDDKTQTGKQ